MSSSAPLAPRDGANDGNSKLRAAHQDFRHVGHHLSGDLGVPLLEEPLEHMRPVRGEPHLIGCRLSASAVRKIAPHLRRRISSLVVFSRRRTPRGRRPRDHRRAHRASTQRRRCGAGNSGDVAKSVIYNFGDSQEQSLQNFLSHILRLHRLRKRNGIHCFFDKSKIRFAHFLGISPSETCPDSVLSFRRSCGSLLCAAVRRSRTTRCLPASSGVQKQTAAALQWLSRDGTGASGSLRL